MREKTNKVILELKKTGLRVLNEKELQVVGGAGGQEAGDCGEPNRTTDTTDVTSISTARPGVYML